jgi:hypothetical protein
MTRKFITRHQENEEIVPLWGRFLYCQRTEFDTEEFVIVVASQGREMRGKYGVVGEYYVDVRNGSYYSMNVCMVPKTYSVGNGIVNLNGYNLSINYFNTGADTLAAHTHRGAAIDISRRLQDGDFDGTYEENVERHGVKTGQLKLL